MKPAQIVSNFRDQFGIDPHEAVLYARLFSHFLADHVYVAERENGSALTHADPMGFREWLIEIEQAAARQLGHPMSPQLLQLGRKPSLPVDRTCPDCGHQHADEKECGWAIGGGRICRCERKVLA